jgi:hypothetical protein
MFVEYVFEADTPVDVPTSLRFMECREAQRRVRDHIIHIIQTRSYEQTLKTWLVV